MGIYTRKSGFYRALVITLCTRILMHRLLCENRRELRTLLGSGDMARRGESNTVAKVEGRRKT